MGEFLVSKEGIGYLIIYGTQVFNLDLVLTGVAVLIILSYIFYKPIAILESKMLAKTWIFQVFLILQFIIRFKEIMHLIQSNHIFISSFCNFYMGKYQQYCSLTRGLDWW